MGLQIMKHMVNILYHRWKGYHPLYWMGRDTYYFTCYNIQSDIFPKEHTGYRIIQKIQKGSSSYNVINQFQYRDQPMEEDVFAKKLPYRKFICKPIGYEGQFVYRIHLLVTPPSAFFDSLQHGYFIRNQRRVFTPKTYYDPFTTSILRDNSFIYVERNRSILDGVDFNTFPYVARDFLIRSKDIYHFIEYMMNNGWEGEQVILTQEDIFEQLKWIENRIQHLKSSYKNKELKDYYIYEIFNQRDIDELQRLMGQLYIDIHDMCNSYVVLWDEALELKSIFQKNFYLGSLKEALLIQINEIYKEINSKALEEISRKRKLLDYLLHILRWKMDYIAAYPIHEPLREWILAALGPFFIFANQLDIWDDHRAPYQNTLYKKHLTFSDEKYRISFDSKIDISPVKDHKNKTIQEELKFLIEEYRRKPDSYNKRRIQDKLEDLKNSLKIIDEINMLLD